MNTKRKKGEFLQDKVLEYFRLVDPVKKIYKCLIEDCRKEELSGSKKCNLVAHARNRHKKFFDHNFAYEFIAGKKQSLEYARLKYIQTCVEIVAVNGNPFTKLNESGIRGILQDELNVLKMSGAGSELIHPNYGAIKKHISYLSSEIRNEIKSEVCGKFVAVMVDTATKHNLSILGLSIQYIIDGQHKIRTIGMINLTEPQTALYLKDVIFDRLQQYGIKKDQMISFTTDNANSMTAMVQLMNDHPVSDAEIVDDEDDDDSIDGENDWYQDTIPAFDMKPQADNDVEQNEAECSISDSDSDEGDRCNEANNILNENEDFDKLLKELRQTFSAYTMNINGIRCAAHTIQLAIQDALASDDIKTLLKKCKRICKLLRKKKVRFLLRQNNIKIPLPRLDCQTRWNSKFRMVIDVLLLQIENISWPILNSSKHIHAFSLFPS